MNELKSNNFYRIVHDQALKLQSKCSRCHKNEYRSRNCGALTSEIILFKICHVGAHEYKMYNMIHVCHDNIVSLPL